MNVLSLFDGMSCGQQAFERVVYKDVNGHYKKNKVLKVEVICSLGFENEQANKN